MEIRSKFRMCTDLTMQTLLAKTSEKQFTLTNISQSTLTARWATIFLKSLYFCLPSRKPLMALCCSPSARMYVLGKTMVGRESVSSCRS